MKKYKLIKEYPNSLKLGSVLTQDEYGQYIDSVISIYSKEEVEDYPEFWEECKPHCKSVDGVDLFVGDSYYWLKSSCIPTKSKLNSDSPTYGNFSTKEAAEKYLEDTTVKKYTLRDLENAYEGGIERGIQFEKGYTCGLQTIKEYLNEQ